MATLSHTWLGIGKGCNNLTGRVWEDLACSHQTFLDIRCNVCDGLSNKIELLLKSMSLLFLYVSQELRSGFFGDLKFFLSEKDN